jgi:hypothetical protein
MRIETHLKTAFHDDDGWSGFGGIRTLTSGGIIAWATDGACSNTQCFRSAALTRHSRNGVAYATYGNAGVLHLRDFSGFVVDPAGRVVWSVSGSAPAGPRLETVAPDGQGTATWPLTAPVTPVAVLSDGRVLVMNGNRVLSALNADGTTDPTLAPMTVIGTVGVTATRIWDASRTSRGVRVRSRALAGGDVRTVNIAVPQIPDQPRRSFFTRDILVTPTGAVTLVGRIELGDGEVRPQTTLMALLSDGRLNTSFGRRGLLDVGRDAAVAVQSNGAVVVARTIQATRSRTDLVVRRLTRTGRLDSTFPVRRIESIATAAKHVDVEIDSQGRAVIGVGVKNGVATGMLLVRLRGR